MSTLFSSHRFGTRIIALLLLWGIFSSDIAWSGGAEHPLPLPNKSALAPQTQLQVEEPAPASSTIIPERPNSAYRVIGTIGSALWMAFGGIFIEAFQRPEYAQKVHIFGILVGCGIIFWGLAGLLYIWRLTPRHHVRPFHWAILGTFSSIVIPGLVLYGLGIRALPHDVRVVVTYTLSKAHQLNRALKKGDEKFQLTTVSAYEKFKGLRLDEFTIRRPGIVGTEELISVFEVAPKRWEVRIVPHSFPKGDPASIAQEMGAVAAINGGYISSDFMLPVHPLGLLVIDGNVLAGYTSENIYVELIDGQSMNVPAKDFLERKYPFDDPSKIKRATQYAPSGLEIADGETTRPLKKGQIFRLLGREAILVMFDDGDVAIYESKRYEEKKYPFDEEGFKHVKYALQTGPLTIINGTPLSGERFPAEVGGGSFVRGKVAYALTKDGRLLLMCHLGIEGIYGMTYTDFTKFLLQYASMRGIEIEALIFGDAGGSGNLTVRDLQSGGWKFYGAGFKTTSSCSIVVLPSEELKKEVGEKVSTSEYFKDLSAFVDHIKGLEGARLEEFVQELLRDKFWNSSDHFGVVKEAVVLLLRADPSKTFQFLVYLTRVLYSQEDINKISFLFRSLDFYEDESLFPALIKYPDLASDFIIQIHPSKWPGSTTWRGGVWALGLLDYSRNAPNAAYLAIKMIFEKGDELVRRSLCEYLTAGGSQDNDPKASVSVRGAILRRLRSEYPKQFDSSFAMAMADLLLLNRDPQRARQIDLLIRSFPEFLPIIEESVQRSGAKWEWSEWRAAVAEVDNLVSGYLRHRENIQLLREKFEAGDLVVLRHHDALFQLLGTRDYHLVQRIIDHCYLIKEASLLSSVVSSTTPPGGFPGGQFDVLSGARALEYLCRLKDVDELIYFLEATDFPGRGSFQMDWGLPAKRAAEVFTEMLNKGELAKKPAALYMVARLERFEGQSREKAVLELIRLTEIPRLLVAPLQREARYRLIQLVFSEEVPTEFKGQSLSALERLYRANRLNTQTDLLTNLCLASHSKDSVIQRQCLVFSWDRTIDDFIKEIDAKRRVYENVPMNKDSIQKAYQEISKLKSTQSGPRSMNPLRRFLESDSRMVDSNV